MKLSNTVKQIYSNRYSSNMTYVVKNINNDTLEVFDVYGRILDLDVDSDQVQIIGSNGVYTDTDGYYHYEKFIKSICIFVDVGRVGRLRLQKGVFR